MNQKYIETTQYASGQVKFVDDVSLNARIVNTVYKNKIPVGSISVISLTKEKALAVLNDYYEEEIRKAQFIIEQATLKRNKLYQSQDQSNTVNLSNIKHWLEENVNRYVDDGDWDGWGVSPRVDTDKLLEAIDERFYKKRNKT